MAAETDSELILRSIQDPRLFEVIFDRHYVRVYRYIRRRLGDELAEEVAAEAFARAFRSRQRFDQREPSALPWLYGITANLIRMNRRSEERRLRAYARAAEQEAEPFPVDELASRVDARAIAPVLAESLAGLGSMEREVLLLSAWAELSHEEIARALGLSPGNVRTRLHRARVRMQKRLRERTEKMVTAGLEAEARAE